MMLGIIGRSLHDVALWLGSSALIKFLIDLHGFRVVGGPRGHGVPPPPPPCPRRAPAVPPEVPPPPCRRRAPRRAPSRLPWQPAVCRDPLPSAAASSLQPFAASTAFVCLVKTPPIAIWDLLLFWVGLFTACLYVFY